MEKEEKINQTQFFDLITSDELSWQAIIYDLIKTEQLDPWDIDLTILAEGYLEKIQELEEADFFVSSKVLLACSLLLRLKSELLINKYIQDLNDALYGRKEENKYEIERIDLDEDELPVLVPRTPIPRHKKVTLNELMSALGKAIDTENRRIKKEIKSKQAKKLTNAVMPKSTRIPLKTRIKGIYISVKNHITKKGNSHMKYSELAPSRNEKIACFLPILHLSNNEQLHLRQPKHFEEIHLSLERMKEEIEEMQKELELLEETTPEQNN